jgi:hypothetical protein
VSSVFTPGAEGFQARACCSTTGTRLPGVASGSRPSSRSGRPGGGSSTRPR